MTDLRDGDRVRDDHARVGHVLAERAAVVAWLRRAPRACGVLIHITSSQDIARCADAIERGEHLKGNET